MRSKLSKPSTLVPVIMIILAIIILWRRTFPSGAGFRLIHAYEWGFIALATVWLLIWFLTERLNPFSVVIGADGRPSTSKLKPFLWMLVIFFSYAVLYSARVAKGQWAAVPNIPTNVLIALGFSVGTWVAAKSITESQVSSGQIAKLPATEPAAGAAKSASDTAGAGAIVQDDKGYPDLSKIQTMAWTLLAMAVYLVAVDRNLHSILSATTTGDFSLPDIDASLMVLTGLGDAAYIGKKLVTTNRAIISGILPTSGKIGTEVTITGTGFGANQLGSQITIDDAGHTGPIKSWKDTEVRFNIPGQHPKDGKNITAGQILQVGIVVNGLESNKKPFTVVA